jgi:hypothetical protein
VFRSFIPEGRRDKKCTQCWDWKSALDDNKLKIKRRKGDSNNGKLYIGCGTVACVEITGLRV